MSRFLPCFLLAALLAVPVRAEEAAPAGEDTAALCVRRLGSEDPEVRRVAYRDLKKMRRKAIPALEGGLKHVDPEVAAACGQLLELIRSAQISVEGGPIPPGTPWWKARAIRVSVDFRDTPVTEIVAAFPEDVGYTLRLQPMGTEVADRRVTLKFERAPLEFVLGWLLWLSADRNLGMPGSPRLGWGTKEVWFGYDQRATGDKVTVEYGRADALAGLSDTDVRAIAGFLDEVAKQEDRSASVRPTETGIRVAGSAFLQVDSSRLIDDLRLAAAGAKAAGAELDADAVAAGGKLVVANWWPAPYDEALDELSQKSGAKIGLDPRARNWTDSQAWYRSAREEPVTTVLNGLCERISTAHVEQRWGGWWIVVDMNPQATRQFWVHPVGDFVRDMMMADSGWQPPALESWVRSHLKNNSWGGAGNTAFGYFPDSGRFALQGNRPANDLLRALLDGRRRETEIRRLTLAGQAPPAETGPDPGAIEAKLLARLARDRITKEQPSQGFEENRVFQEVFSVLHDALDVRSTSGSWGGMNARNALRACRLKDVTPRVLWHWLNQGIPFYLYYYPDRKSASYGIGTTQPWDGWTAPTFFTRGRLHPTQEKAFVDLLEAWDPQARKAFVDVPAVSAAPAGGPVCLPRPAAEKLFRLVGLGGDDAAAAGVAAPPANSEALDKTIAWPGGKLNLEEALFKVAELADVNFVLDVTSTAKVTRKLETEAREVRAREVIEHAVREAGVGWTVGEEQIVWVTGRGGDGRAWVPLEGGVSLGGEEAAAVAVEFAREKDELVCFAPTGRFFARCAPERTGQVQAAFRAAIAAAREAAGKEAEGMVEGAAAGQPVPAGYAGALALEKAGASSPAALFTLADRIAATGHARDAYRRFQALALAPGTPAPLASRARGRAARLATRFGPADPRMDAEAMVLAQAVEAAQDAPADAVADALQARAEILRRSGDREGAMAALRRLAEVGGETEESRRWLSRLEGLR